jgi:hypothetical protein
MSTKIEEAPVFLLGMHRSGTTLLQCLLDGHPELVVDTGESCFFTQFVPRALKASPEKRLTLAEEILLRHYHQTDANNYRYVSHVPWEDVRAAFHRRLNETPKRLPDYLTSAVLGAGEVGGQLKPGVRYWAEKTPHHEMFAEQIFSWWPKARCIHVMRDPRGTFSAIRKRKPKIGSVDAVAYMWSRSAGLLKRNQEKFGAERYLGLRYEDMVTDPQMQMERVREFLGIADNEILYRPTKAGGKHDWGGNSAHGQKFSGIDASSLHKWREITSVEHIALLETLLFGPMQRLNYEMLAQHSISTKMKALPLRARIAARQVRQVVRQRSVAGANE